LGGSVVEWLGSPAVRALDSRLDVASSIAGRLD